MKKLRQLKEELKIPAIGQTFSRNLMPQISPDFINYLKKNEINYKKSDLVKINILLNEKILDVLEFIVHKKNSYKISKELIEKLSKIICIFLPYVRLKYCYIIKLYLHL